MTIGNAGDLDRVLKGEKYASARAFFRFQIKQIISFKRYRTAGYLVCVVAVARSPRISSNVLLS